MENSYEYRCLNQGYEKMNYINNSKLINSWKNGTTGFPLIDASMKCLIENGWINFRIANVSFTFFCHYLEQSWKIFHLEIFLGVGIHFTQF